MNNCAKIFVIASALAVSAGSAYAVDYLLEAGQTDAISTNVVYDKMIINGNLAVSDKAVVRTPSIIMTNGSVTVTTTDTVLGSGHSQDNYPTTWKLYPDENGKYGCITVKDCATYGKGPEARWVYLQPENEAAKSGDGYIDFLRLENGGMSLRRTFNCSSLTGRISVAGINGGSIYREGARSSSDTAIFALHDDYANGGYRIEMEDDADLNIHVSNQGGMLNDAGCLVEFVGNADVELTGGYSSSYPFAINKGAVFNNTGTLTFTRCSGDYNCCFDLNDNDVIGRNLTDIRQVSGKAAYDTSIRIGAKVTVTVKNVTFTGTRTRLISKGDGARVRVNADEGDRTFKARILSGDALTIEKIGTKEMIVASPTTNFSNLVVSEGTVRFINDCVIENLKTAEGVKIIADGCRVSLPGDVEYTGGAFETANGGEIVFTSSGRNMLYNATVSGNVHFSGGTNVFSCYGIKKRYWRWTVTDVANSPHPLRLRGLYLFAGDGSFQNSELSRMTEANELATTVVSSGKYRLCCHSTTNFTIASDAASFQKITYSHNMFHVKNQGNNYCKLGSPLINPDDPESFVQIEMCLSANAKPITGYNLRKVHENGYGSPRSWIVETSDDGRNWDVVERRSDVPVLNKNNTQYYTYDDVSYIKGTFNAKEYFHFIDYRTDGLEPSDTPVALQADGGAVVDLRAFTGGQAVNALIVDCSAGNGGGEIFGAKIAESGVLTITNADALLDGATLPLSLPESIDGANLKNWSVIVDGVAKKLVAKLMPDGTLSLTDKGTVVILR